MSVLFRFPRPLLHRVFAVLAILVLCSSCVFSSRKGLPEARAQQLRSFAFNSGSTLIDRVKPVPGFVLDFLKKSDKRHDYSSYSPAPDELALIKEYLDLLPEYQREVLQRRLIAFYFIGNFVGSGMTFAVIGDHGEPFTVIVFNPDVLKAGISTWMTYRENTCFLRNNPQISIAVNCGSRYRGFLYILLHEAAHVVDYVERATPFTDTTIKNMLQQNLPSSTLLTEGIWRDISTPVPAFDFDGRKDITFYGLAGGPRIGIDDAPALYERLARTPFVSLYGSQNWADDFAELATWYHFTVVLGEPYEVLLKRGPGAVARYAPMELPEVKKRVALLQAWLENHPGPAGDGKPPGQ